MGAEKVMKSPDFC